MMHSTVIILPGHFLAWEKNVTSSSVQVVAPSSIFELLKMWVQVEVGECVTQNGLQIEFSKTEISATDETIDE